MALSKETEAEILRLHYAEKWKKGTIARQLQIHHSTVERILLQNGVTPTQLRVHRSIADPYIEFIKNVLNEYPKLNATRLYYMACERGYPGKVDHFRRVVKRYRPRLAEDAFLRLRTLPGEEAQVDWACFGKIKIGKAERKLYAFVMVLSWSRQIFLQYYLNQGTANFQRGHIAAFEFFGKAVPRKILYDNCKVVVRERIGPAIIYNPELLALAAHYRFQPLPVAPYAPEQKGKVERGIRYVRSSFWSARSWKDLDDLNTQAIKWCLTEAANRRWTQDPKLNVGEAFERERTHLIAQPEVPYPVYDRKDVSVGKTPYVRYDGNFYSIPPTHVKSKLTVFATLETVKICDGMDEVAVHKRSFDKDQIIENEDHIQELKDAKRAAYQHRNMNRLQEAAPSMTDFLVKASQRGHNLGRLTQQLNNLLDSYGASELEIAIKEALEADRMHADAVQQVLECRRESQKPQRLPVKLRFEKSELANELIISPQSLDVYKILFKDSESEEEP